MRPRLEWLETFLAIVETGSLTRAGEEIARSQSAVSLQLRQLEEAVGARLFRRDTRRVALTTAGERLVPLARRALDAAQAAGDMARDADRRVVRAGVPDEYVDHLVPSLIEGLGRRDPLLSLEVECAASPVLERRVRAGRLALAFALADEVESGDGIAVASDPVAWLQAPEASLAQRRPLPVALFDHACSWRRRAIEALESAGIEFNIVFTSASVAGVRAGIRAGVAVGALAASTAGAGLVRITGRHAPPPLPAAELVLLQGNAGDRDARLLISGAREELGR